ncbi:MAG: thioredoxin domain-containing protein, partial [Planctomycetota bacterium]
VAHAASDNDMTAIDGAERTSNRLANETSPYLLQHQYNPVDWYPWGDEAFEAARAQDKPIFLSVGYSTCYWCHVMERECFENADIAALMNDAFICIKVDREERPDVDDIYMMATQLLNNGHGGWPMSVVLEPTSLRPFFAGTYFPPEDRGGRLGFPTLIQRISTAWTTQRPAIDQQAEQIAARVADILSETPPVRPVTPAHVQQLASQMKGTFDPQHAGFGNAPQYAPKFPTPVNVDVLMEIAWDDADIRPIVTRTLDRMAIGGMYDQIGGGFHRYSTDREWLVPHFEKMLYDNAQLASTYSRAYELTGDAFYAEIVRETLDYVLREMTDDAGGFYSAQDAEVDAREGKNYLWRIDEARAVLDAGGMANDAIERVLNVYGLSDGTNFRDPHYPQDGWFNVIRLSDRPDVLSTQLDVPLTQLQDDIITANQLLLDVRDRRKQPGLDDKIITSWNGLMIAGFADGGRVLNEPKYIEAATRAAEFIESSMRTEDGSLLRTYRDGEAKVDAFLEDYAAFAIGLIALHRAGEPQWGTSASAVLAMAHDRFYDDVDGGYFDTLADQADLFVRAKGTYDGAIPSGNSLMFHAIVMHPDDAASKNRAMAMRNFFSASIATQPTRSPLAVRALHHHFGEEPTAATRGDAADVLQPVPDAMPRRSRVVKVTATPDRIRATAGAPATMTLILTIARGYHINAREPGQDFLIPLDVDLVDDDGLTLDVAYPDGDQYEGSIADGPMQVHGGRVAIPLTLTAMEPREGHVTFAIRVQACNDQMCLAPETIDVTLPLVVKE